MASVEANGITIEYADTGPEDAPVILLIRGLGTQMTQWPPAFIEALRSRGLRVVTFDNRDIGLSTSFDDKGPPDIAAAQKALVSGGVVKAPYSLDDMAADAIALLDQLGVARAHIFGISMGGMIAQILAADYPDRVASVMPVMTSTREAGLSEATPEANAALFARPDDPNDKESIVRTAVEAQKAIGSPGYPIPEDEIRAAVIAAQERSYRPMGVGRQMLAVFASGDLSPRAARIKAPALVIHGVDDPLLPIDHGRAVARAIPRARIEEIAGMGHNIPPALAERIASLAADHALGAENAAAAQ